MISVAIDGPAGAGKSTIAKALSKDMGYIYVDTGALYRTVGLYMLRNNISTTDAENVGKALDDISVEMKHIDGVQRVFLNGEDVSDFIRTEEVSMAASNVSAIPSVRAFLLSLQRDIAKKNNIVMDGRDIATVVLPNATVKIFLTASAEERATRRYKELIEKGQKADYDKVLEDIKTRDYNDSHREIAPLKPSEESVIIDTTDVPLKKAIEMLKQAVEEGIK
jgi:cytidylate kinase